jgi:hypothetical protein
MSTNDNYVKITLTVVGLACKDAHARFQQVAPRLCQTWSNNVVITDKFDFVPSHGASSGIIVI